MQNHLLKKTLISVTIVGMIFTSAWALDARYAKASEVQAQITGLTILVLEIKLSDLRRQLFDILVAERRRELTNLELIRKNQLQQEIQFLKRQMGKK